MNQAIMTSSKNAKIYPLSIAPMMDRTFKHYRYFMRLISAETLLYTEMIPADAICYGKKDKILSFDPSEHPISLQLGGSQMNYLKEACSIASAYGYDEINLNVGCPSDRVQEGKFGACLMKEPQLVADLLAAMQECVTIPVTIKHRIGIDDHEDYDHLANFVSLISKTGCKRFSIHARKAILQGLSPKENRTIPPLKYDFVYQLKKDFPHLIIEINGGIKSIEEAKLHLEKVDGVMIGRAAWDNPYLFAEADELILGCKAKAKPSRGEVLQKYEAYFKARLEAGDPLSLLLMPIFNLYNGIPGASKWKQYLSENGHKKPANAQIISHALQHCIATQPQMANV